jgi:hypothetical protein
VLREVDLEYLVDRKGSMTDEVHWEDVLSLGEKQRYVKCIDLDQVSMLNNASALTNRLAIARLVHHKPRFGEHACLFESLTNH